MNVIESKLKERSVIITGASGGIGSETARLFARHGARVLVNYNSSRHRANRLVKEIEQTGGNALAVKADVSNPAEVVSMIQECDHRFGGIDALVNNASCHPPPVFDFKNPDWAYWKRMVHVNMMGILVCSHYAAPFLKSANGCIVNITMDYDPGGLGYVATKAAGRSITRGLARILAPVRVNAVSPGAIDTWGMTTEEKNHYSSRSLLHRVGAPIDIARTVYFLASEDASFITGATLMVDGGKQLLE